MFRLSDLVRTADGRDGMVIAVDKRTNTLTVQFDDGSTKPHHMTTLRPGNAHTAKRILGMSVADAGSFDGALQKLARKINAQRNVG